MAQTNEDKRESIKNRSGIGSVVVQAGAAKKESDLEAEVRKIQADVEAGLTPAQEAEAEMAQEAAATTLVDPRGYPVATATNGNKVTPEELEAQADRLKAQAAKDRAAQAAKAKALGDAVKHDLELADMAESAYKDFRRRGYDRNLASELTAVYATLVLGAATMALAKARMP